MSPSTLPAAVEAAPPSTPTPLATTFPTTIPESTPNSSPSSGTTLPPAVPYSSPKEKTPGATPFPPTNPDATPKPPASGASSSPETRTIATPRHRSSPGEPLSHPPAGDRPTDYRDDGDLPTLRLQLAAAMLDDVEGLRIATENRLRSAGSFGLPTGAYEDQFAALVALERRATLDLQRALRLHPLGPWVKATVGIGEKQGARLIASVGDPSYNHAEGRVRRGPAELWAYCGYAPGQQRRKGVKSNWNAEAKMRAYLCAESCMKQRHSPYRAVYDAAKASWADRPVSDGHRHNHALRLVAKEILKDLYREAVASC